MYQEIIEPPADNWDELDEFLDDVERIYESEGSEEEALFEYECMIYNELDRRYA